MRCYDPYEMSDDVLLTALSRQNNRASVSTQDLPGPRWKYNKHTDPSHEKWRNIHYDQNLISM